METTPTETITVPQSEDTVEAPKNLSEGIYGFSNKEKEKGAVIVENKGGELMVAMVAPMEANFQGGKKVIVATPDGRTKEMLDVSLLALSPKNTEAVTLTHLQLDRDTLTGLLALAAEQGILPRPKPSESKWAPGGKMEQMTRLALKLDEQLG